MSGHESVQIETRDVGEMAREEVAAARAAGVDPLSLARTHDRVAAAIRDTVRWQNAADQTPRVRRAVEARAARESADGESR